MAKANGKRGRLYHLTGSTIRKVDALAALYGTKEAAVATAIDATYRAAERALKRLRVKAPRPRGKGRAV